MYLHTLYTFAYSIHFSTFKLLAKYLVAYHDRQWILQITYICVLCIFLCFEIPHKRTQI